MGIPGIDCSFSHPDYRAVKRAGYQFVARYLTRSPAPKVLTSGELDAIRAAGLDLVLVFEDQATRALDGYQAGHLDAIRVAALLETLGLPDTTVVYFAVDFALTVGNRGDVLEYFRGLGKSIPAHLLGVYGGRSTIELIVGNRWAHYGWQTVAWSGGIWSPLAQVRQTHNGVHVAGADVDINEALSQEFGAIPMTGTPNLSTIDITAIRDAVQHDQVVPVTVDGVETHWSLAHMLMHLNQHAVDMTARLVAIEAKLGVGVPPVGGSPSPAATAGATVSDTPIGDAIDSEDLFADAGASSEATELDAPTDAPVSSGGPVSTIG